MTQSIDRKPAPVSADRASKLLAINELHTAWVLRQHELGVEFNPDAHVGEADYNLHSYDLDASGDAQDAFDNAARAILARVDDGGMRGIRDWMAQPRDPSGEDAGQWVSAGGALKDVLKLGGKVKLDDGEELVGSDKVASDNGIVRLAVTRKDGQQSLRLGAGDGVFGTKDDEAGPWRADPGTLAELNAERGKLRDEQQLLDAEHNQIYGQRDPLAEKYIASLDGGPPISAEDDAELDRLIARQEEIQKRLGELDEADTVEVQPSGYTAKLDQDATERLRTALVDALAEGARRQADSDVRGAEYDRLVAERHELKLMDRKWTDEEEARWDAIEARLEELQTSFNADSDNYLIAQGSVPGEWADVHYEVIFDDPTIGVQADLTAVPHGMTLEEVTDAERRANLDAPDAGKLVRLLDKILGGAATRTARDSHFEYLHPRNPADGKFVGDGVPDVDMGVVSKVKGVLGKTYGEVSSHVDKKGVHFGVTVKKQPVQVDISYWDMAQLGLLFIPGGEAIGALKLAGLVGKALKGAKAAKKAATLAKKASAVASHASPAVRLADYHLWHQPGGLLDQMWQRAQPNVDFDESAHPRNPSDGKFVHAAGSIAAALEALGGEDGDGIFFDDSRYIDWSVTGDDGFRRFEVGGATDTVTVSLDEEEELRLSRAFARSRIRQSLPAEQQVLVALAAERQEGEDDDDEAINFDDGTYFDWSAKRPNGARVLEVGDSDEAAQLELTAEEFNRFQATLALSLLTAVGAEGTTRAYDKKAHPKYPKGSPGGKGGQWMPQVGEALEKLSNLHARGPVKVRPELAKLKSVADVNTRLRIELRRVLKRPVDVDLGSDTSLITAKEYGEGLLRGAERWPETRLDKVSVGTPPDGHKVWGLTTVHPQTGRVEMLLDAEVSANRTKYLRSLRKGAESGRPGNDFAYVAASLFGSAVDGMTGGRGHEHVDVAVKSYLHDAGLDHTDPDQIQAGIKAQLGDHALYSRNAMVAEALADDALHGEGASPLAQRVREQVATAYNAAINGKGMPAVPDLPAAQGEVLSSDLPAVPLKNAQPGGPGISDEDRQRLPATAGALLDLAYEKNWYSTATSDTDVYGRDVIKVLLFDRLGSDDKFHLTWRGPDGGGGPLKLAAVEYSKSGLFKTKFPQSLKAVTAHVAATPDIVPPAAPDVPEPRPVDPPSNMTANELIDSLLAAIPGAAPDVAKAAPVTGFEALDSVPVKATFKANAHMDSSSWSATGFVGLAKPDPGAVAAVTKYLRAPWFVNKRLRSPSETLHEQSFAELSGSPVDTVKAAKAAALADRHIAALDRVMAQSKLPRDIVTYRGVGLEALGDLPGSAVGHSWSDPGYASTATDRSVAEHSFSGRGSALLRIAVPEGTPALGLDGLGETEVLLARGLTYRVTADHGLTPGGARLLDVEIVPNDAPGAPTPVETAKKAAPAAPAPVQTGHVANDAQARSGWQQGDPLIHARRGPVTYLGPDEKDSNGLGGGPGGAHWVEFDDGEIGMASGELLSGYVPPAKAVKKAAPAKNTTTTSPAELDAIVAQLGEYDDRGALEPALAAMKVKNLKDLMMHLGLGAGGGKKKADLVATVAAEIRGPVSSSSGNGSYGSLFKVSGPDILSKIPATLANDRPGAALSDEERNALEEYRKLGPTVEEVNTGLRSGTLDEALAAEVVRPIDAVMARSQLGDDMVVDRGIYDLADIFPGRAGENLAGGEWVDPAFVSTTLNTAEAEGFAYGGPNPTVLRIRVPKGTPAVQLSGVSYEAEVLLGRGNRFRVLSDSGPGGMPRRLDVELIPVVAPPPKVDGGQRPPAGVRAATVTRVAGLEPVDARHLGGGSGAELFTYSDGSKVVKKNQNRRDNDGDELGALVGDALGLHTPATHRDGDRLYMEYMPGTVGTKVAAWSENQDAILDSRDGRLIGLLDVLLVNADRNTGNWIQRDDGGITAIDHGFAWEVNNIGFATGSPFARRFFAGDTELAAPRLADNDMSPADMATFRQRLEALRPEFDRRGRSDWHAAMMGRLGMVAAMARGTESRLPGPAADRVSPMDQKLAEIIGGRNDGLDDLTDRQLRGLGGEYEVPGRNQDPQWMTLSDADRQHLLDGLREKGALAPEIGGRLNEAQLDAWLERQRELGRLADAAQIDRLNPNKDGLEDLVADVRAAATSGTRTKLAGGAVGTVERVELPSGRQLFAKQNGRWQDRDAATITDAETLTYLLARAIDAPVPRVVRTSEDQIYTDWVDGRPGVDLFLSKLMAELEGPPDNPALQALVESGPGKRLGLLDLLTGNGDRHTSNWMVDEKGGLVGIDHGNAWWYASDALATSDDDGFRVQMSDTISGVFTRLGWIDIAQLEDDGTVAMVDTDVWTAADVADVRNRLSALRPAFADAGHEEWLEYSLRVLDMLEPHATGRRSIFND